MLWDYLLCRVSGGLGFSPREIGNALGLSSVPLVFLQVFLFPLLERKFGSKKVTTLRPKIPLQVKSLLVVWWLMLRGMYI